MTAAADQPETGQPLAGSNRLPIIATSINEHLVAAKASMRRGVDHAIAAGLLLMEAKELLDHGEWLPWLVASCQVGPRQAQTSCDWRGTAIRSRC